MIPTSVTYGSGGYAPSETWVRVRAMDNTGDNTHPLVMSLHGATGVSYSALLPIINTASQLFEIAAGRYTVFSPDAGGGVTFGNDTALNAIAAAQTHAKASHGAKTGKIALHGTSMGAANALGYTRANPSNVACVVGTIPAIDIEDIRANNRGGYQATIHTAYGSNALWQAARPTHNPVEFASEISAIPVLLFCSSNDPICIRARADAFATAHGNTTIVDLGAVSHDAQTVNPVTVREFVEQHLPA